jgi:dihydroorotate dehydrogenase
MPPPLARYDIHRSYDWNYEHAPEPPEMEIPGVSGSWNFLGIPVNSPLGMPAGPLLNSGWILYYAALGFDVLTYKTVRSAYRASYDPPNLLPVAGGPLRGEGAALAAADESASWAISFGMPSKDPSDWRADVERARKGLGNKQALVVSVVASPGGGWPMKRIAKDFADCARWAAGAGAHAVEANLSCPNVCTKEAGLYLSPDASAEIAAAVREASAGLPVALKVGLFPDAERAEAVLRAVAPHADAVSATNSITARVTRGGKAQFGGLVRGIGGEAITVRCLEETALLAGIIRRAELPLKLISVGGVMTAADVKARLAAGAHHVQLATAPMLDPLIGIKIRRELV